MPYKEANPYLVQYLCRRGYPSPAAQERFLCFSEKELRDVRQFVQAEPFFARLQQAIDAEEPIVIYGDYDADGILAAYILYSALDNLLPGKVEVFINDRFADGYSMTAASMEKLLQHFPETRVILTCDNGISAAAAVETARTHGVEVLVTDHHEQGTPLPEGTLALDEKSILQKKADAVSGTQREDFCGAELARRVVQAVYEERGLATRQAAYLESLFAFAGVATITDSVPLHAANHFVARRGLLQLQKGEGFWRILQEECGLVGRRISGDTIGFTYGPMINAGGRVSGSARYAWAALQAYHLGDETACRQAIREMHALNDTRKAMCVQNDVAAFAQIREKGYENDAFLLLYGETFAEGINGLTAAHLVERYGVPAAVLSPTQTDANRYKGSARSVPWFNLFEHLSAHPDEIVAGGHPMAAGLQVQKEDLETVRRLLREDAEKARAQWTARKKEPGDTGAEETVDFFFTPEDLSLQSIRQLQEAERALEPFGPSLEAPRAVLSVHEARLFALRGKDGREHHAKWIPTQSAADGTRIEILWWNHIEEARALSQKTTGLRVIGRPEEHEYNGNRSIQFIVQKVF